MVVEEKERAQQLPVETLCARSERGGRRRPREISRWDLAPGRPLFSVLVRVGWEGQGKNDGKNEGEGRTRPSVFEMATVCFSFPIRVAWRSFSLPALPSDSEERT